MSFVFFFLLINERLSRLDLGPIDVSNAIRVQS